MDAFGDRRPKCPNCLPETKGSMHEGPPQRWNVKNGKGGLHRVTGAPLSGLDPDC